MFLVVMGTLPCTTLLNLLASLIILVALASARMLLFPRVTTIPLRLNPKILITLVSLFPQVMILLRLNLVNLVTLISLFPQTTMILLRPKSINYKNR